MWCVSGASHDSPRNPNVHILGPRRFKHHQNSTRRPPREGQKENCGGRGKQKREILGLPPFGPHLRSLHPPGPTFAWASLLRIHSPFRGPDPAPNVVLANLGLAKDGKTRWPNFALAKDGNARLRVVLSIFVTPRWGLPHAFLAHLIAHWRAGPH